MHYYIDGFNLLFKMTKGYADMRMRKREILLSLNTAAVLYTLDLTIVFDGKQVDQPLAVRTNLDELRIIYTPFHQTADTYLLSLLDYETDLDEITIISSDREVTGKAKQKGAHILSSENFLIFLDKKSKKQLREPVPSFQDNKNHIERLSQIFKKKLDQMGW
jgi:predicted RNA-binding protein with PIN domain